MCTPTAFSDRPRVVYQRWVDPPPPTPSLLLGDSCQPIASRMCPLLKGAFKYRIKNHTVALAKNERTCSECKMCLTVIVLRVKSASLPTRAAATVYYRIND